MSGEKEGAMGEECCMGKFWGVWRGRALDCAGKVLTLVVCWKCYLITRFHGMACLYIAIPSSVLCHSKYV